MYKRGSKNDTPAPALFQMLYNTSPVPTAHMPLVIMLKQLSTAVLYILTQNSTVLDFFIFRTFSSVLTDGEGS